MIYELLVPLLILAVGVVLLAAEDLLPTGGALGVLAVGCLMFLLYLGFSNSPALGVRYLFAELLIVPAAYGASTFLLHKTGLKRLASLRPPEADEVDVRREGPDLERFVGQKGRASSPLRPSGLVELEGRRLDAVAESGMIDSGATIQVLQVRSGRLIVRRDDEETTSES